MEQQQRPDPDALLAAIKKEQERQQRGKLKIFFGMAAGVGKTYAMLKAAHKALAEGTDVVIGYVETHGRRETAALTEGLPLIPRRAISYKGTTIEEMDIDAVLARKPALVLVDELAHTNAPGSRHSKRWQDVLELLDNGLHVVTTLNVQHVESRADVVAQITGVPVCETVPDLLLDIADDVEIIDVPPDSLLNRLSEGKVYTAEKSQKAVENFFRKGNLTALREMALRVTAERVDQQLRDYMQQKRIAGPWKSGERLMVAVGPSPFSEKLIRWTRRMAYTMEAPWVAVTIETTRVLSERDKERLAKNVALARELGAEIITTTDDDIVDALLRVARQNNATQIVVGKPLESMLLRLLGRGTLVDQLIRKSGNIDIYVVRSAMEDDIPPHSLWTLQPEFQSRLFPYVLSCSVVLCVAAICYVALPLIGYQAVSLLLLFTVLLLSLIAGRGPILLAATTSAVVWNYFFIPPQFTLHINRLEDVLTFFLYFFISLVTGTLTARVRRQQKAVRQREERTTALYALSRELTSTVSGDEIIHVAVRNIGRVFSADVAVFVAHASGRLTQTLHPASTLQLEQKEFAVADWVFANGKKAGRFTTTLPFAQAQYYPLVAPRGVIGVVAVQTRNTTRFIPEQETLIETFLSQTASALERELLNETAKRALVVTESERLYKTLMSSMSHELKTPLAAILGASSSLLEYHIAYDEKTRYTLAGEIHRAASRLHRLVENMLDMTRLESGVVQLRLDWCDISDLISVVLQQLKQELVQHQVTTSIPDNLPFVRLDFVLMEQAIANILHNAAIYTPAGSVIRISAHEEQQSILLTITDNGSGLSPDALDHIFDKFYRVPGSAAGGTGLGLSITRGFIEAHGGSIVAKNAPDGGAQFIIQLPTGGTSSNGTLNNKTDNPHH